VLSNFICFVFQSLDLERRGGRVAGKNCGEEKLLINIDFLATRNNSSQRKG